MSQAYCQGTQRAAARAATQVRDKGPVGGVVTLWHGTGAELAEELAAERACAHVQRSVPYPDDTSRVLEVLRGFPKMLYLSSMNTSTLPG